MSPNERDPARFARQLADLGLTRVLFNLPAGDGAAAERVASRFRADAVSGQPPPVKAFGPKWA